MFQDILQGAGLQLQAIIGQRSPYIIIGVVILLLVSFYRLCKTSAKLPLPYYYVKDNVVATLEEAYRDV